LCACNPVFNDFLSVEIELEVINNKNVNLLNVPFFLAKENLCHFIQYQRVQIIMYNIKNMGAKIGEGNYSYSMSNPICLPPDMPNNIAVAICQ